MTVATGRYCKDGCDAAASVVNSKCDCDVVLEVVFHFGISKDHAEIVTFILSDNKRKKLNRTYASGDGRLV